MKSHIRTAIDLLKKEGIHAELVRSNKHNILKCTDSTGKSINLTVSKTPSCPYVLKKIVGQAKRYLKQQ